MNKKVLSAILFSALFAGTGTFTSCIDNDEPAGIEELRGAKAELLRAKVAVEQANAAFKLAQAEVQKAEAARLESLAKINEASARLEEARAEAAEIQNDADRATLEKTIAEYEMYLEEATLAHEATMIQNQQALAIAKRQYEIALKGIEIAEALMSEQDQVFVSELKDEINTLLGQIEDKEHDIEKQQDVLYNAAKYIGAETKYQIAQAEIALNSQKAILEAKELEVEKYKKYLELDSTATESDWRKEIAEIEAEIAEYDKKMAEFQLELVKNKESEETKALEKAVKDAEAAKAAIEAPKTAEELAYTYVYWDGIKNNKIVAAAKDADAATAAVAIAGNDFMDAEEYGNGIAALKKEIASYTVERKYWLDSIASNNAAINAANDAAATKALNDWSAAKTAYETAKTTAADVKYETPKTAYETYKTTLNTVNAMPATTPEEMYKKYVAETKAKETFADALVAWYDTLPTDQVTFNNLTLSFEEDVTYGGQVVYTKTTYVTKTVKQWLSDEDNKAEYLVRLVSDCFGTNGFPAYWAVGAERKVKYTNGDGEEAEYTTAKDAFNKVTSKDDYILAKKTLLQTASDVAFGAASQYANNAPANTDNWYLHKEPSVEDFMYVWSNGGNVGTYGKNKLGKDEAINFIANNYEAIIADYEAAIEYWTAAVDDIKEALTEYDADVEAAQDVIDAAKKAFDDHKKAFVDAFNNAVVGLQEKIESLKNVKWALINVVDEYLAESYNGEGSFITFLQNQLKVAENALPKLVYNVEKAEVDLEAAKEGKFFTAHKVEKEQEMLAKLEEELAELLELLEVKLAELATAESIWAGTAE